jgi:pyruvate,water dikinase
MHAVSHADSNQTERLAKPMAAEAEATIRWLTEIEGSEADLVGRKGANLGLLTRVGLPVPPGFVITTQAYRAFLAAN